ncbi:MAG: serine O-acetyltransferase EpsC [Oribacterium sp.]
MIQNDMIQNDVKRCIADISAMLYENYQKEGIFEITLGTKLPKRTEIIEVVTELRRLMFPGFFGSENTAYVSLDNFAGSTLAEVYEKLFRQIRTALQYHCDLERGAELDRQAGELTLHFIDELPRIQCMLMKDADAVMEGDPAAKSREEVIFSYPGIFAIFVYRIAHALYSLQIPFIPRIMSEYAHGETGIDINPGAEIGEYFFIDHGTGIVIGETTRIGDHVKIYQGVTLGALSPHKGQELSGVKRHPTIEDNVVIYANSTILGGETVIGRDSVIAGNTFIMQSVPAKSRVSSTLPELRLKTAKT